MSTNKPNEGGSTRRLRKASSAAVAGPSASQSTSGPLFEISESVYVEFGGLLYDAKVVAIDAEKDAFNVVQQTYVRVHYHGWSKKSDEWLAENDERILKKTPANTKKAEEMKQKLTSAQSKKKSKAAVSAQASPAPDPNQDQISVEIKTEPVPEPVAGPSTSTSTSVTVTPKVKAGSSSIGEKIKASSAKSELISTPALRPPPVTRQSHTRSSSPERIINIPDKLKAFLVEDAKATTQTKQASAAMFPVDESQSIDGILVDYVNAMAYSGMKNQEDASNLVDGIKEYFNYIGQYRLMFRSEHFRLQELEDEYKKKGAELPELTSIFGAAHLLRLFTFLGAPGKIPVSFGPENIATLVAEFDRFLNFLLINFNKYFVPKTEPDSVGLADLNTY